jgi:hypothetical protein
MTTLLGQRKNEGASIAERPQLTAVPEDEDFWESARLGLEDRLSEEEGCTPTRPSGRAEWRMMMSPGPGRGPTASGLPRLAAGGRPAGLRQSPQFEPCFWRRCSSGAIFERTGRRGNMADLHPYTFRIERDLLNESRLRWLLCEGDQIVLRSPHSYATRREAETEARAAMGRHADKWRVTKRLS